MDQRLILAIFYFLSCIAVVGEVNGYIRDCSNGSDFSADFRNATHLSVERGFLKLDNQTGCGYSPTHFANLCVSVCNTNFCNGPFSDGGRLRHMTVLEMIGLCLVLKTFQKLLQF
ncbi:hypothetical protein MAR_005127 [Mya arenaria]|uniref:Protein sleepless n=1 Tax=Mya arenaria TaxID=6604 RepID=A0ABY7EYM3_MYAAR|nr:hypothetical protein MAR_005127 [Mya arenaria]